MERYQLNRRDFLKKSSMATAAVASWEVSAEPVSPLRAEIQNPYGRTPVSLIIDDSTCLVNMAHFGIPQFAEVFPNDYKQEWRKLPREIPDAFVRKFGLWSQENGIRGKYSIVPYPACTGFVNRFIPGWTKAELTDSLNLVREVIMPNWDIHPEMVSHTRVIDIKTGKPFPQATPDYMENWGWSQNKSADELAAYQSYALEILRDAGLHCDGITTPGGYGSLNQDNLARSVKESVQGIFGSEIAHYFRDLFIKKSESVEPKVFYPTDLSSDHPSCVVSIYGCTEDWFGDWDGLHPGHADLMINASGTAGRLVDVINAGEPAVMVCHWPGLYFNGEETGFNIFKQVVSRLKEHYPELIWMKLSEIARYWAARKLTQMELTKNSIKLQAPFQANGFTIRLNHAYKEVRLSNLSAIGKPLKRVGSKSLLASETFFESANETLICMDIQRGLNSISLGSR
jgi:hypothetical protein